MVMPRNEIKTAEGVFKGVSDGPRLSVAQMMKPEYEIEENLKPEHFHVSETLRHGFPYQPTAIAYDPVQRLLVVGTKNGSLRFFGRPGVDCHVQHLSDSAIIQISFLVNDGALITVCDDDSLHFWNYRQKRPEILHSLKFQKERITCCHLPFQCKWLYIGTKRGNVHVVNVESFVLSGYLINWNKAIDLSCRTHPGEVVHLSDNPLDPNKLLIGFLTGLVVLWDLRSRSADSRFQCTEYLTSVSWNNDGKQFICSHTDGSLSTWNIRSSAKPLSVIYPHAKVTKDGKPELCKGIDKVEWRSTRGGDSFIIFSGGLPYDRADQSPSLTVIHGKVTTVLEMEHSISDFITLCETPWQSEFQEPYAVVVLFFNDLVVVDLTSPGYPCFQNPYPMNLHESPVTYCSYFADCPTDLIPAFYSVGCKENKTAGLSDKEWPIDGGEWGSSMPSYFEIIITGHADGSLKFWDASSVFLLILYKLKSAKIFETKSRNFEKQDDPLAIEKISFCAESRTLAVAGASAHVILFKFAKTESVSSVPVIEIPILYEIDDNPECFNEFEFPPRPLLKAGSQHGSFSSASGESPKKKNGNSTTLRVKSGPIQKVPGFQAELVCLTPWIDGKPPGRITALSVNSCFGLMAYGNEYGIALVDIVQKTCLMNLGTPYLYGYADPYRRVSHSPKKNAFSESNSSEHDSYSPSSDQNESGEVTNSKSRKAARSSIINDVKRSKSQEKFDNSLSRSQSSSMSSLETISSETIQMLIFTESFCRKGELTSNASLWIGTSLGSILAVILNIPPGLEARQTQPVTVSPSGTIFRLKGAILSISFLDSYGALIGNLSESWKDNNRNNRDKEENKIRNSGRNRASLTTNSSEIRDSQFIVMTSEKEACVLAVPSQTCMYKLNLTETSFVVKAEVISIKGTGNVCLTAYIGNGNIVVYSLPSLKLLLEVNFFPSVNKRIASTLCFSNNGHGLYMCSPSELQKFSVSSTFCDSLQEMLGVLYLIKEMPEPPKPSFFKGLFGGEPSTLDREELFGEANGKASQSVARHIPGNINVKQVRSQTSNLASELVNVRHGLVERGEKLSRLEERTGRMLAEAEAYYNYSQQLKMKYTDTKKETQYNQKRKKKCQCSFTLCC